MDLESCGAQQGERFTRKPCMLISVDSSRPRRLRRVSGLPTFSLVTAALTLRLASRVLIPIPALRRDRD